MSSLCWIVGLAQLCQIHTIFVLLYMRWVQLKFYSSYFDLCDPLLMPDSCINVYVLHMMLGMAIIGNILFWLLLSKLVGIVLIMLCGGI